MENFEEKLLYPSGCKVGRFLKSKITNMKNTDNEMGEMFRQIKQEETERRREQSDLNKKIIAELQEAYGFYSSEIQPGQIRIMDNKKGIKIDIFTKSNKYHDIIKNRRGTYKYIDLFILGYISAS